MKVWVSDHLDHSIRNLTLTRASPSDPVVRVLSIFGSQFLCLSLFCACIFSFYLCYWGSLEDSCRKLSGVVSRVSGSTGPASDALVKL